MLRSEKLAKAIAEQLFPDNSIMVNAVREVIEKEMPELGEPEYVENAKHYLCDSDELTIAEMVERIANHENQYDWIDDVDGVIVWQPLEFNYDCDEFLQLINYPN